jgi:hypothetical protein
MFSAAVAPWIQGGAVGILAGAVWMLLTGRLMSRRLHDEAVALERLRAQEWRDAFLAADARADLLDKQMGEVLAFTRSAREAA